MGIGGLLSKLFGFFTPYWRSGLFILAGLLLEMAFTSLVPYSFKFVVDDGLVGGDHTLLVRIIAGLAIGAVVVSAAGLGRDYLYARLVASVLGDIRYRMFNHLQRLSMEFYARARTGDIVSRFSGDLSSVETALTNALPWGVLPALQVIANTLLLFLLDWRLALVAMLVWPLVLFGPRVFAPLAVKASYVRRQDEGEAINAVQEAITSQPAVKALGLQRFLLAGFSRHNTRLSDSVLHVSFLSAMVERSAGVGIMLLQVLVLGVGAWMASQNMLTIGTLSSFQALFLNLSFSLSYTTQYVPTLVQATGGMQRIDDLLSEVSLVSDADDAAFDAPVKRAITLKNVKFGYTTEQQNLDDVSLEIRAGTSVAFVGASGSGKSTILNLIMRLYDPQSGSICFDDRDLRTVTQEAVRRQMGVVFQESFLFNVSAAENIRMGKLDATQEEIVRAAQAAEIHEHIVAMPQGYDTPVGERGGRLSGGQRQRLAIARAILRDPHLLVLDEATSALDPATEAAINATLKRIGKGRTIIAVTHRLASVNGFDCIYVLDRGKVVERGSHAELLANGPHYARLWAKQSGFSVSADGDHVTVSAARLRTMPVLDQLDEAMLAEAARLFITEQHPAGRMVMFEGDRGDRFYIIVRGSVEVIKGAGESVPRRIAVLQDGDYFGEIALLRSVPRTASVRARSDCTFLSLQREQFNFLVERVPLLRTRLESLYGQRTTA